MTKNVLRLGLVLALCGAMTACKKAEDAAEATQEATEAAGEAADQAARAAEEAADKAEEAEKTLYERLGGYDGISAVVDEFAGRLFKEPKISQFFAGMGDDSKEGFRQKNKNLLTNATGGPAKVISRPANVAHGGLGITEGDFKVVADHLKASLDKFKVPKREQDEVFEIILSLKPDIVERKTKKLSQDLPR